MKKSEKALMYSAIIAVVLDLLLLFMINYNLLPGLYGSEVPPFIMIGIFIYIVAYLVYCIVRRVIIAKREMKQEKKEKLKKIYNRLIIIFTIIPVIICALFYILYIYIPDHMLVKKPIIYIYPEEEMNVSVSLSNPSQLTHSYPTYQNGWNIQVKPNGDIIDITTGKSYYALYWEGKDTSQVDRTKGFVVRGEDTQSFLEEKLKLLGLNEREANEFIIYWLPQMENNPYNFIHFRTKEELNRYMQLNIEPKPDHMIRVYMDFKPLTKEVTVDEQQIETPTREGYHVVEWGGRQIN